MFFDAHDAGADVDVLKRLVDMKIPTLLLLKHSCSLPSAWVVILLSEKEKKNCRGVESKSPKGLSVCFYGNKDSACRLDLL